jgi:hypothetical protein
MAHGTKQVDCLCKWLCRWLSITYQCQLETQILSIQVYVCVDVSVLRYVWVVMHFRSILGHLSCLLISHFIWSVPTVKLLSHIIDMFLSPLRGVNGTSHTDFDHFIRDFRTLKSGIFMPSAQWRQRALKCYPWNWQSTISLAYQFNQILYGQFFKIYTHSCFLCLKTTTTSRDRIVTSLVACTALFGGDWQSWLCTIVINNSLLVIWKLNCSQ